MIIGFVCSALQFSFNEFAPNCGKSLGFSKKDEKPKTDYTKSTMKQFNSEAKHLNLLNT